MLEFFIIFLIVGFIIGVVVEDNSKAIIVILTISIVWIFIYGAWAIATLIELLLGYSLTKKFSKRVFDGYFE